MVVMVGLNQKNFIITIHVNLCPPLVTELLLNKFLAIDRLSHD